MTFMLIRISSPTLQSPWGDGLVAGFSLRSTYSAQIKPPTSSRWLVDPTDFSDGYHLERDGFSHLPLLSLVPMAEYCRTA